jgi:hypothetical protein
MSLGTLRLFKIIISILFIQNLNAANTFDFDFIKKGQQNDNTLLIVGGIQGDEPGAFMAASLIATHYKVTKGSVWVVPNLNFYSIIKRSRGPHGDMNRKFAHLSPNDPDYDIIQRIKLYISDPSVRLILNLHDGSGFYRKKHTNYTFSPYRWGQSTIIDQTKINVEKYGNLFEISQQVCDAVNKNLIRKRDVYNVKNTKTKLGDKEMEKTLTYYAINKGKAAFGNEASKVLPLHERVYYHLLAIEEYMNIMGIEYERKFELSPRLVRNVIDNDIYITFYDDKIKLPLSKVRDMIRFFPISENGSVEFKPSSPIMTVVKKGKDYVIHYGNRRLAKLRPDYTNISDIQKNITFKVDGKDKIVRFGDILHANNEFMINPIKNMRVNIIGYVNKKQRNEAGLKVKKEEIRKRYSIDREGKTFRIEFYKQDKSKKKDKFAGMILLRFDNKKNI